MSDEKYNGWTNYATWRVNLELLDGMSAEEFGITRENADDAHEIVKEYVEQLTDEYPDGFVKDYCMSFLGDVDWRDIARHYVDELPADADDDEPDADDDEPDADDDEPDADERQGGKANV